MKKSDKEIEDIIDHQMKLVADEMVKEITNSDEYRWLQLGTVEFLKNGNFVGLDFLNDPDMNGWEDVDFIELGKRAEQKKIKSRKKKGKK